jgi:hypothetical protein
MEATATVTLTLSRDEFDQLKSAVHDAASYWWDHKEKAAANPKYHLEEDGCHLLWKKRTEMYEKLDIIYKVNFTLK